MNAQIKPKLIPATPQEVKAEAKAMIDRLPRFLTIVQCPVAADATVVALTRRAAAELSCNRPRDAT